MRRPAHLALEIPASPPSRHRRAPACCQGTDGIVVENEEDQHRQHNDTDDDPVRPKTVQELTCPSTSLLAGGGCASAGLPTAGAPSGVTARPRAVVAARIFFPKLSPYREVATKRLGIGRSRLCEPAVWHEK